MNHINEVKTALRETSKYFFSHHKEDDYYRCYKIGTYHFCARCTGIYLGILVSVFTHSYITKLNNLGILIITIAPFFAYLDWSLSYIFNINGKNIYRSITGFLLGFAYFMGIRYLFDRKFVGIILGTALLYLFLILIAYLIKRKGWW